MPCGPLRPVLTLPLVFTLTTKGVLRLVDGWYLGVEAEVLAVDRERRLLTVRPLDQTETNQFICSPLLPHHQPLFQPRVRSVIFFSIGSTGCAGLSVDRERIGGFTCGSRIIRESRE